MAPIRSMVTVLAAFYFAPTSAGVIKGNMKESSRRVNSKFAVIPVSKIVAFVGADVHIPCDVANGNSDTFLWTNEEGLIKRPYHKVLKNGTLVLRKISRWDSGNYRCKVSSGKEAIVSASVQVNVTTADDFWNEVPPDLSIPLGSKVRITCSTSFFEEFELCLNVRIKWLRNGNYINEGNTRRFGTTKCGALHVHNFIRETEGSYKCEVTLLATGEKFLSPPGELKISLIPSEDNEDEGYLYLPSSPPVRLLHTPSEVVVILGQQAVLECPHNDVDSPYPVKWTRTDDRKLVRENVRVESSGNLIISKVTFQNSGTYKCSLTSALAESMNFKYTMLHVLRPPVLLAFPPTTSVLRNGDLFRFNCSAAGVPTPTVEFFKDGAPYAKGGSISHAGSHMSASASNTTISEYVILLVQEEDEGVYQCSAKNAAGVTSKTSKLTWMFDSQAPEPPTNVIVKEVSTTSLLFQWDPPKDLADIPEDKHHLFNYDIFFGKAGVDNHAEEVLNFDVHEKLYTKLQPNTNYTFYMRVLTYINDSVVMSDLADVIYQVTNSEIPTIVSAKLNLTIIDPTTLRVNWKSLPFRSDDDSDSVEVQQIIQWWTNGVDQLPDAVKTLNPNFEEYDITDVPAASTKVKVLIKYIPDHWETQHKLSKANFDVLNYSEWTKISQKKSSLTSEKDKLQLFLTANASTSVLAEWLIPSWLAEEGKDFNLSYVNERDKTKKFSSIIRGLNYHSLEGLEPGCYKFSLTVTPLIKISRNGGDIVKSEAAICTLIGSSLIQDKFYNADKSDDTLNHNSRDSPDLSIWNIFVQNYTSKSITLQWTPQQHSQPDFYLLVLKELRRLSDTKNEDSDSRQEFSKHGRRDDSVNSDVSKNDEDELPTRFNDYVVINSSLIISTRTSIQLLNLTPNTKYEIQMAPGTLNRVGEPISPLIVTTLEGVPSAPQNLMWIPVTTSSVNISWTPPGNVNGILREYLILFSRDLIKWENKTVDAGCTHTILTGLVSNTKYSVRISGVTKVGPGAPLSGEIFIQAILDLALTTNSMSMEMIIICVISTLVIVTGVVLTYLITTMCRQRRRASLRTQASPNRLTFAGNGIKDKDMAQRAEDSKGQPDDPNISTIEVSTRHLDTKGRQINEENLHLLETPLIDEVFSGGEGKEIVIRHPLDPTV